MARIRALARDEAPADAQPFFDRDVERYGTVLNTTGIYAYCPSVLAASRQMGAALRASGRIPEGLRALINVRVASRAGCPF